MTENTQVRSGSLKEFKKIMDTYGPISTQDIAVVKSVLESEITKVTSKQFSDFFEGLGLTKDDIKVVSVKELMDSEVELTNQVSVKKIIKFNK